MRNRLFKKTLVAVLKESVGSSMQKRKKTFLSTCNIYTTDQSS